MSARQKRRERQAARPAAPKVQAAAKPLNNTKVSRVVANSATRLPPSLDRRLVAIEERLDAVEQLTICPLACGASCPWRAACAVKP
jgi:hypothetical protein